jgi:hypothetical protein
MVNGNEGLPDWGIKMYIDVSLAYLRSIASWKPFTVSSKDGLPALSNVNFVSEKDDDGAIRLVAQVTDRYRIVHRSDTIGETLVRGAMFDEHDGEPVSVLVPIDLIVQFVTATKTEKFPKPISVRIAIDSNAITIEGASSRVSGFRPNNQYPKIAGLLGTWTANDAPLGTVGFDVTRVADFTKLVSPIDGKKYGSAWKFEQGRGSDEKRSGSYRLTNRDDEALTALLMPLYGNY